MGQKTVKKAPFSGGKPLKIPPSRGIFDLFPLSMAFLTPRRKCEKRKILKLIRKGKRGKGPHPKLPEL